MSRNVYTVSTPLSTIQRSNHLITTRSANPTVNFVPEEVADLNDPPSVCMDQNGNDVAGLTKHVSTIKIGNRKTSSSSSGSNGSGTSATSLPPSSGRTPHNLSRDFNSSRESIRYEDWSHRVKGPEIESRQVYTTYRKPSFRGGYWVHEYEFKASEKRIFCSF